MTDTLSGEILGSDGNQTGTTLSGEVAEKQEALDGQVSFAAGAETDSFGGEVQEVQSDLGGETWAWQEIIGGGCCCFPEIIGGEVAWEACDLNGETEREEDVLSGEVEPSEPAGSASVMKLSHMTVTGATILVASDPNVIEADASGGAFTVTLPAVATADECVFWITRRNGGGNTVTIDGNGAETINGSLMVVINRQYVTVPVHCNGTNWRIL